MTIARKDLHAALISAFPSRAELARAVRHGLGVSLNAITPESDLEATVFALLEWAEAKDGLNELLEAACKENPGNPALMMSLSKARAWSVTSIPRALPPRRLFVGRESEIDAIRRALERSGQSTIAQASLWGLGGVGKTALALEYAHRTLERGDCPAGVWWLVAEGKPLDVMTRLADLLGEYAPNVVGHVPSGLPPERRALALRLALEAHPQPSLIVLDNVDHTLSSYLPGGKVKTLLTTRDFNVSLGATIALDVLSHEDAKALAVTIAGEARNEQEAAALERVVNHGLGALAVAVEVAANAVKRWVKGWGAYEGHLAQSIAVVDRERHRSADYPEGVFAALDMSISKAGATARRLLEATAAFAPDAVPLEWAYAVAELDPGDMDAQEACGELEGLGLFKVDRELSRVSLHRLVHLRVRERAAPEVWSEVTGRMVINIAEWVEGTVGATREQMEALEAQRAHIDKALCWAKERNEHAAWSMIANELALHLQHRADYRQARSLFRQALAMDETTFGPDHPMIAIRLSNLALVHKDLGEPEKARPLLERALTIDEEAFGPDHPNVATSLSNLAFAYQELGEPERARPLLERALAIDEKTFGPDHPAVARDLSNLATVHKDLKKPGKARPLLERSLAIDERTFGPDHPNVAIRLSNLAGVRKDLGEPNEARPLLERALAIDEETFGPEHPYVAIRLSNLALVRLDFGEHEEARPLLERALGIATKRLGPDHPDTVLYRNNLVRLLTLMDQE